LNPDTLTPWPARTLTPVKSQPVPETGAPNANTTAGWTRADCRRLLYRCASFQQGSSAQALKLRLALIVEHDQFAVEHDVGQLSQAADDLREALRPANTGACDAVGCVTTVPLTQINTASALRIML